MLLPGFKGTWKHDLDDSKVMGPQTRTVMKRTAHTLPSSSKEEASTKPELMSEKTREAVIWHVKKCINERSCAICNYLKQMNSWSDATSVKLNNTIIGSWLLLDSDSDKQEVGLSCPLACIRMNLSRFLHGHVNCNLPAPAIMNVIPRLGVQATCPSNNECYSEAGCASEPTARIMSLRRAT